LLQRSTFLALIVLALSACSRQGGLAEDSARQDLWAEQQVTAGEMAQWNLYARAALRLKGEAYNISLQWKREADDRFEILLEAPFGQGVLRIDAVGPGRYRLRLPDGRLVTNNSVEALLDEVVGWSLPIGGLDYWVRGVPDPRTVSRYQLDSEGRARSIRQDGWDITYRDYFEDSSRPALPRRFSLANDQLTLKLVIERWQQVPTDTTGSDLFPSFN
jgi:outer membrane lipoprotein LolB